VEKLDPSDVLKRIDEALAETRGGTAAEVTMLDPDWEDEAKRAHTEPPSTVESKSAEPKPPESKPAAPKAKTEDEDVPDWAKQDAEDEKDTKDDGKGGQQKLF
jgi:hypothetical protein